MRTSASHNVKNTVIHWYQVRQTKEDQAQEGKTHYSVIKQYKHFKPHKPHNLQTTTMRTFEETD